MAKESLIGDLITNMNKKATSTAAYLQGDHAQHTWGIEIPHLAFQWLIGGSNVLPAQRYFGISGEEKSYKSTLDVEIGNWYMMANGLHVKLDTENKTSPEMMHAMTWWRPELEEGRRIFKVCSSITEWQNMVMTVVERTRNATKESPPKQGEREAIHVSIDSLMGRSTEEADRNLRKEGHAAERGFPVASLQVTNFLEALNLLGTPITVGWIQHMKASMDQSGAGYGGPTMKEKGAKAAQFACSTHLRVSKGSAINCAKHDSAPYEGYSIEGRDLWLTSARSCIGPDNRRLMVPLMWQYVKPEGAEAYRQVMWYDWDGALGMLLRDMKYSEKFKPKLYQPDKERLAEAIEFSNPKTNEITCKELGLDRVSCHLFGKAVRENIEVYDRVRDFLRITEFPTIQNAEIDWKAGDLAKTKK